MLLYCKLTSQLIQHLITLILNARLNPLAKNPPNGPITELNIDNDNECRINGYTVKVDFPLICAYIKEIIKHSYST